MFTIPAGVPFRNRLAGLGWALRPVGPPRSRGWNCETKGHQHDDLLSVVAERII
jgi:hypothetical protein